MLVTTKIKLLTNEEQHRILKETKPTVKSRYIGCATTM
jgi:hypothetical protein